MARAILVDDERLALDNLEKLLLETGGIEIVGKYQDPRLALEAAFRDRPDVVFLDIEMPEISGIDMAERLQSQPPYTNVIFVTAYDEYAIKAFELNAMDYVLKPIQRNRLALTVQRLLAREENHTHEQDLQECVMIRCFQSIQLEWSGNEPIPIRWRTTKAQELFAFLIYRHDKPVRKDALLDMFWPEVDFKKGFTQLYTTIYQIRKTLESIDVSLTLSNYDGGYMLDFNGAKLDVDEYERGVSEAPPLSLESLPEHRRLLQLYRGDYLADYDYMWAESERQRLKAIWLHHASTVAEYLTDCEQWSEAITLYSHIQSSNPYAEDSYFALMRLYDVCGDRAAVEQQYESLAAMLDEEYQVAPQPAIQSWYKRWKENPR